MVDDKEVGQKLLGFIHYKFYPDLTPIEFGLKVTKEFADYMDNHHDTWKKEQSKKLKESKYEPQTTGTLS